MAEPRLDANGDEIVCEGVHSTCGRTLCVYILLDVLIIVFTVGIGIFVLPCLIVAHCYAIKNWKLYLTHTDIHYQSGCEYSIIPFTQINHISAIPGSNCILINTKGASLHQRGKTVFITNIVRIDDVVNCKEFVVAARKEIFKSRTIHVSFS